MWIDVLKIEHQSNIKEGLLSACGKQMYKCLLFISEPFIPVMSILPLLWFLLIMIFSSYNFCDSILDRKNTTSIKINLIALTPKLLRLLFWSKIPKIYFLLEVQRPLSKVIERIYIYLYSFIQRHCIFLIHSKDQVLYLFLISR